MLAVVAPIHRVETSALETAERSQLVDTYVHAREVSNEWMKRQIIARNRIDILATAVLGYKVMPFHLALLAYQFAHPDNQQWSFRGAGKSTVCTVTKCIHLLLKDPNLRILISSKTAKGAEVFLTEIKSHFQTNERLAEIFGAYHAPNSTRKWDTSMIEVDPRTSTAKESSITCVGVGGQVIGKHYDVLISDDLVSQENTLTKYMRDKLLAWYYQTLDPCLEPPDDEVEHRGEHHRLGTRYHYDDLYGHLQKNELKEHTQVIPALDNKGRSPWPEKFTPDWFDKKRRKSGLIIFNAQFQCDTEAMKGEIFEYDDCQIIEASDIPSDLGIYMGVDLAISEKDSADHFAIVVIGMDGNKNRYGLDYFEGQLRFRQQTAKIIKWWKKWDPIRIGIETNAYQAAQYQNLKDEDKDIPLKGINTGTDKILRAQKLQPIFSDKRFYFQKTGGHHLWIEQMVLFPNYRYKDVFDATDLAVAASKVKRRKRREKEPGVI